MKTAMYIIAGIAVIAAFYFWNQNKKLKSAAQTGSAGGAKK